VTGVLKANAAYAMRILADVRIQFLLEMRCGLKVY